MSKALVRKLKAARQKLAITQKAMAERLGVPLKTYVNWEQGLNAPRGIGLSALNAKLDALLKTGK